MEDISFVTCRVCGKKCKSISHFHVRIHKMTVGQYSEKFPDAPLVSQELIEKRRSDMKGRKIHWKDKISKSVKKSWQENRFQGRAGIPLSEESREKLSKKMMGHDVSQETNDKISESGMGREPWNKGLDKYTDKRLRIISDKTREWNKKYLTQEIKDKIAKTLRQRYLDGMPIPNSKNGFREDLGISLRSTWEADVIRILNFIKEDWAYEEDRFLLKDYSNGKELVYITDFRLLNYDNLLIEVKGHADSSYEWKCNCRRCVRDKRKLRLFAEQYPEYDLMMIGKYEYASLVSLFCCSVENLEANSSKYENTEIGRQY